VGEKQQRNKKYQKLQIEFEKGENPDDACSSVPYDKGANFLLHIGWCSLNTHAL
jgi:leukotriene-A4 hydrolase